MKIKYRTSLFTILISLFMFLYLFSSNSFASNDSEILNNNELKNTLSRKLFLSNEEKIKTMSRDELLNEIKNYESDVIDLMENMKVLNEQITFLETQISLLEVQKDAYLNSKNETKIFELNKLKAIFSLPSIYLTQESESSIEKIVSQIEGDKIKSNKILLNINSIGVNSEYKKDYLQEIDNLRIYVEKESSELDILKEKINSRIEELNRIEALNIAESQNNNPYINQGTNVDIPDNIECDELVETIIRYTAEQIGIPYLWGGTTPRGFDCSGLLYYSFGKAGVSIPRVARDQQKASVKINYEDLKPGDLVFWNTPATHVALYIGDGKIIEAPRTGLNVRSRYIKLSEKGISFGRILNK